ISNRPDFAGADWRPFQPTVENWRLAPVPFGEEARVYVAFRDEAGNVSTDVIYDGIVFILQRGDTFPFDGSVDLNDLNNVRNAFGQSGQPGVSGDAIGAIDGVVDLDDLNEVRNHFGESVFDFALTTLPQTSVKTPSKQLIP